jgi:flagellar hook-associated protein 1 FlgK
MSLNTALQIGRSGMVAAQAGMSVAGNNMANAATVGFHRQTLHLAPARGEIIGRNTQVGRGVEIQTIRREIDVALQSRYRDAVSDHSRNLVDQRFLTAIETLQNELTNNDISSALSVFFNSFSELANNPEDGAVRNVVIQEGRNLASRISALRQDYNVTLEEVDRSLENQVIAANDLLDRIATINMQIAQQEGAGSEAAALRDQRDLLIDELAGIIDVTVVEQPNGAANVLVGSIPVVLGGVSRGIELRAEPTDGATEITIRVADDGTFLQPTGGAIGGLMAQRDQTIRPVIDGLDEFTGQLIQQVNRLHSQGQGRSGFASINGTTVVQDAAANLNAEAANLPFRIENGSFFVHVTHGASGTRTTHEIQIDGDAQSLNDLIASINATIPNVTAGIGANGQLTLTAATGYQMSFSDDTSGALAALGVNTFFSGSTAADIDVNQVLIDDPNMLAAGAGHVDGSNDTARQIADLQDAAIEDLGGRSLREYWQGQVNSLATRTAAANAAVQSSTLVKESLSAQVQAVSGVSLDEESINLLQYQRQFQAAARFISIIDDTLQTLLSIA